VCVIEIRSRSASKFLWACVEVMKC